MSEFKLIQQLQKIIPPPKTGLGLGDDAATFKPSKNKEVFISTDALVENVDFLKAKAKPEEIGRKALAINLSDMAAMGAKPKAFVIALGLPPKTSPMWVKRFYKGMLALAKKYEVICLGGDLSSAKEIFTSVTILGEGSQKNRLTRDKARVGDKVAVTGKLGGSILRKHFLFEPRVKEGEFLAKQKEVHALMDISDGFVQDLGHILQASGKGSRINLDEIPISKDAEKLRGNALDHALSDGEDFELLFTVAGAKQLSFEKKWRKAFPKVPLSWLGEVTGKSSKMEWFLNGKKVELPKRIKFGYNHFR